MIDNIREIKAKYRLKHRELRASMSVEQRSEFDSLICDKIVSTMAYKNASQILMYSALGIEVNVKRIFDISKADGKRCFFPICGEGSEMSFRLVDDLSLLTKTEKHGIYEPVGNFEEYTPGNGDLCIVPALTYDVAGYRMGFGGGYYDRFLSSFGGIKLGACYSCNIERLLPRGKFDVRADILITEKGLFRLKV